MDNAQAIMQELWRAANTRPEGITIPCPNEQQAISLRFALYNSVKRARSGRDTVDDKLKEALANCSISFTPDKCGLVIKQKASMGMLPQLLVLLGGTVPEASEVVQAKESAARIMEQLAALQEPAPTEATPAKLNPYGLRHSN